MKKQTNSGITLIALVITIIILLILAGITINIILGENGIISHSQRGKTEYTISQYLEEVEIARGEVAIKHLGEITLDHLITQIYENKVVPEGNITKLNEQMARMVTKEEYVFIITADSVQYLGMGSENNIVISEPIWDPNIHTATIEISKTEEADLNAIIQYQINGVEEDHWIEGTQVEHLYHNDIIYARLWNGTASGKMFIQVIKDSKVPQEAKIELTALKAGTTSNVGATIALMDQESGVAVSKSKWIYTDVQEELGVDLQKYENYFVSDENPQGIILNKTTPGTYYLHVLTQDIAGNRKETISEPITVSVWAIGIALNKTQTTIERGKTETLTATIQQDEPTNKVIKWTSSNEAVAKVSSDGTITAVAMGKAIITATIDDGSELSASCTVTVALPQSILTAGKYVNYNSGTYGIIKCRVLYPATSSYGLQLIAHAPVKNVTIGSKDKTEALEAFKNLIRTLNAQASLYLNRDYAILARCVGSNPSNPALGEVADADDTYYTIDRAAVNAFGDVVVDGRTYWYASRHVYYPSGMVRAYYYSEKSKGYAECVRSNSLWSSSWGSVRTHGLRPCFKLRTDVKVTGGSGTDASPYTLGV